MAGSHDNGLTSLSNMIDESLKGRVDRAVAGSDYNQKTILSAILDKHLIKNDEGLLTFDEDKLDDELSKWSDHYA